MITATTPFDQIAFIFLSGSAQCHHKLLLVPTPRPKRRRRPRPNINSVKHQYNFD